jgi:hypothetical protein
VRAGQNRFALKASFISDALSTLLRDVGGKPLRWVLVIWLSVGPSTALQPVSIPQSTQASCDKAAVKIRAKIREQQKDATVITACVDQGFAY